MVVIIVVVLVIAIFTSAIASSKGRDSTGWFFLGLLFPVIALIAVAAMPNIKGIPRGREAKTCPQCSNTIFRTALICSHCRYEFDMAAEQRRKEMEHRQKRRTSFITMIVVGVLVVIFIVQEEMKNGDNSTFETDQTERPAKMARP